MEQEEKISHMKTVRTNNNIVQKKYVRKISKHIKPNFFMTIIECTKNNENSFMFFLQIYLLFTRNYVKNVNL